MSTKKLTEKEKKVIKDNAARLKNDPQAKALLDAYYNDKNRMFSTEEKDILKGLKLRDDLFDGDIPLRSEDKEKPTLITPDSLKQEEEREKKKIEEYSKQFSEELSKWAEEDHYSIYDGCEFTEQGYLVRVFHMKPKNDLFRDISLRSGLGGMPVPEMKKIKQGIFPIVKILKIGRAIPVEETNTTSSTNGKVKYTNSNYPEYEVGQIAIVRSSEVLGETHNPKWLEYMASAHRGQGTNMVPKAPKDLPEKITNIEKNWGRFMFTRPWIPIPQEIDKLTYFIPYEYIIGEYKVGNEHEGNY